MGLEEKTINTRRKIATSGFFLQKTSVSSYQRHLHYHRSRRIPFPTSPPILFAVIWTFIILTLNIAQAQAELKVNEFGVRKVKTGDMAMVFYANISHTGGEVSGPLVARLNMDKCCVQVPPDQHLNCQAMKLLSGLGKVFRPRESYILQMYFINFDLLDREGSCNIRLLSRSLQNRKSQDQADWKKGEAFTVPFKTVLKKPGVVGKLISGSSEGYRICDSDNYNALHDCSNFDDCLVRYSGELSLFNQTSGQCVKTPECQDHNSTFLSFITRKCSTIHQISRTVRETLTPDMQKIDKDIFKGKAPSIPVALLQRNNASNSNSSSSSLPIHSKVVCEHGYHVKGKDGKDNCTCHQGWRSLTMEEWQKKGGVYMENWDEAHKMCTVPMIDHKTRGLLLLGFLVTCLIIPFIASLWCNRSKKKDVKGNQSSVKTFLDKSLSSSAAEESDAEKESKPKPVKGTCKLKKSHRVINEMEDEEANKVISEITNRREPTLSNKSSKRDAWDKDDDDDDHQSGDLAPSSSQPSVPPSTKSSRGGGEAPAFPGSKTSQQEGGSRLQSSTSTALQSTRQASRSTMPPDPPPPAPTTPSSSRTTMPPQPDPSRGTMPPQPDPSRGTMPPQPDPSRGTMPPQPDPSRGTMPPQPDPSRGTMPPQPNPSRTTMSSQAISSTPSAKASSGGGVSTPKTNHLGYFKPSSTGFDYTAGIVEDHEVDQRRRYDKLNMNVATQVPSADDLLTMKRREKYGAHHPLQPGDNLGVAVMVADCATVELKDDKVMLNSLSSEEITQKKQQEWAQFIESMSEEKLQFRAGHFSISVESRNTIENFMEEEEEEEGEIEQNSRLSRQSQSQMNDFHYFQKDHNHNNKGKATKVQSVPGMMTYHPFSSMTSYSNPETDLPQPPVHFIQKALKQLRPDEHESRYEAYRILNSLSNERILSTRSQENDGIITSTNSIWSNIASENTQELSGTPTTSAFGSRVESSCDGDEDIVRTNTIYGNLLGSDVDSDEALDEIALDNNNLDPNRTIYGCPPTHTTTPTPILPMNFQQAHETLESVTRPPSDFFIDSTDASTVTSRTISSTDCEFWKNIAGQCVSSGEDDKLKGVGGGGATSTMSPQTSSAYQIKSSLETALKASRSRSGTNLF